MNESKMIAPSPWIDHEPGLRRKIIFHLAELAVRADKDGAKDFGDATRSALAVLWAAGAPW